jgi:hypothetical protein
MVSKYLVRPPDGSWRLETRSVDAMYLCITRYRASVHPAYPSSVPHTPLNPQAAGLHNHAHPCDVDTHEVKITLSLPLLTCAFARVGGRTRLLEASAESVFFAGKVEITPNAIPGNALMRQRSRSGKLSLTSAAAGQQRGEEPRGACDREFRSLHVLPRPRAAVPSRQASIAQELPEVPIFRSTNNKLNARLTPLPPYRLTTCTNTQLVTLPVQSPNFAWLISHVCYYCNE